jgi:hypothetical protein
MPDQFWFKASDNPPIAIAVRVVDPDNNVRTIGDCKKLAIEYVNSALKHQISTKNPSFELTPIEKPADDKLAKLDVPIFHDVIAYNLRD